MPKPGIGVAVIVAWFGGFDKFAGGNGSFLVL